MGYLIPTITLTKGNIMSDTVYKIVKDKAGYYHITYDNCAVSFFHSIEDAKKELNKILKELN